MWLATVLYDSYYGNDYYQLLEIFRFGVRRYHYEKLVGIREFLEQYYLDCFNNPFSTDTGTLSKNMPLLDEVDNGDSVSTFSSLNFSSCASSST